MAGAPEVKGWVCALSARRGENYLVDLIMRSLITQLYIQAHQVVLAMSSA